MSHSQYVIMFLILERAIRMVGVGLTSSWACAVSNLYRGLFCGVLAIIRRCIQLLEDSPHFSMKFSSG